MATMLAIITTDAIVEPDMLQAALRVAVGRSFNRISVDGDMSTNDTVLLLASGVSGVTLDSQTLPTFTEALTDMCTDLAKQIVADGEGATKMIEITVTGAQSEAQAHMVADSIARSPLVKTAIHGGDPNWGRILCAAGYSGAPLDQERLRLSFGDEAQRLLAVERGMPTDYDLARAEALFQGNPVLIQLDLGLGDFDATVWTCDLSKEYVDLNAMYTT
jgi:glutamate N-acetyltransferase/amino-acid N-acetyltransferase